MIDPAALREQIEASWRETVLPGLRDFIRIPNLSPAFDPEWADNGLMEQAVEQVADWCRQRSIEGLSLEVLRLEGRTPLLWMEIEGESDHCVLFYGHLDKQPPGEGWSAGKGPYEPVEEEGRLYGRGSVDDGYAVFTALAAAEAVQRQGGALPRCLFLIECSEESSSPDLEAYLRFLEGRLGKPDWVICLDSLMGDYQRLWCTTSLRGGVTGDLSVSLLKQDCHSGLGSGVAASSFRVARMLLDRIEDSSSGNVLLPELHVDIPSLRVEEASQTAQLLGEALLRAIPLRPGVLPVSADATELMLNNTWRAQLSITGQRGMPPLERAGNMLRKETALKLSMRLPPTCDAVTAGKVLKRTLESDPPYGARVIFTITNSGQGWQAPPLEAKLERALQEASQRFFGEPAAFLGVGGGIPVINMLAERFPEAQMLVTGALGPDSNAHGPDESLHLEAARRLTCCLAWLLDRSR
ncbi:MAG TPA: M20/M25/M40 family metallo-hydrolase [Acidobacteriota bacterium]|nr:M20/M25/M40 family metallo-hydrolase [Acidobacteriota bacterium]